MKLRQARRAVLRAVIVAVPLFVAPVALAQVSLYWDADGAAPVNGGDGTWDLAALNWSTDPLGTSYQAWTNAVNNDAHFGDTAGSILIGASVTARSLNFTHTSGIYTFQGTAPITLAGGNGLIDTGAANVNILGPLSGSTGLTKQGSGVLTLSNTTNNFTGPVSVTGGVLSVTAAAAMGTATDPITLNGGTFRNVAGGIPTFVAGTRAFQIGAAGGTLDVATPGAIAIYTSGSITGPGNTLTKAGPGTLRVTTPTAITFSKLIVDGGLYQAAADNIFGAVPGAATADAITLRNGGGISSNGGLTWAANRGLTLDTGGGVINTSSSATYAGVISGAGSLTKTGPSTLTLSAANTFGGAIRITQGTVSIASSAALGGTPGSPTPDMIVLDGGTLRHTAVGAGITFAPTNRGITIGAGGGTIDASSITAGNSLQYFGVIAGTGNTLTKTGANEFRVFGSNTFSKLVVRQGLYRIGGTGVETGFGAAPASFLADAITLDGGAIGQSLNLSYHPNRGITLGSGGGTINSSVGASTLQSAITGVGGLTKTGAQTVRFTASSDFQGPFTLLDNRVEVWANNALGVGNLAITLSGASNGTLVNNVSPAGAVVVLNNPVVTLTAGTGQLDIAANSGNTLELTGKVTGSANWKRDNTNSAGTVVLSNATSDFTGNLTVSSGHLVITANNALGATAGVTTINTNATLGMRGGFDYTAAEPVRIGGHGVAGVGAIHNIFGDNRFAGLVTMSAGSTVGVSAGSLELAGPISGAFLLIKSGPGTLVLSNAGNSFASTSIFGGTLAVADDAHLGAVPAVPAASNILIADSAMRATASFTLHANRGINFVGAAGALDVVPGATLTHAGTTTGGTMNKTGGGTLRLTNNTGHTGGTNVNAGRLSLAPAVTLGGDVNIAPAGTLHGAGSVGGNVTIAGTIAPGEGPGTLDTTGSQTWAGGGAYEFEIDDAQGAPGVSWDHMTMSAVTVSATSSNRFVIKVVALPGAGGPGLDNFDPDQPYSWAVAVATTNTVNDFDLEDFEIDVTQFEQNNENKGGFYMSRSNGDLMLNYVPEPGAGLTLTLAASALLRRRRR